MQRVVLEDVDRTRLPRATTMGPRIAAGPRPAVRADRPGNPVPAHGTAGADGHRSPPGPVTVSFETATAA